MILFDLDGTLIDSSPISKWREGRQWRECVRRAHSVFVYDGLAETILSLQKTGIPIAVVTNSVSYYASAMLREHGLSPDVLVCYHDTLRHKPDPEPVNLALAKFGATPSDVIAVGDHANDCLAYRAAGVHAIGAAWSNELDYSAAWDRIVDDPRRLAALVGPQCRRPSS